MKVREVIKNFRKEGNPYVVTVPGNDRDEVSPGVLGDIRRKTGLELR